MKKLTLLTTLLFTFMFMKPIISGEVTDTEWNLYRQFVVTYYTGGSGSFLNMVECTAFNDKGSPIGGGVGFPHGGVARVSITVPKKYVRTALKAQCQEKSVY